MVTTVATNEFRNIDINRVVDNQYNRRDAFERAIKVFLMSYPEMDRTSDAIYLQKFTEYFHSVRDLYGIPVQNFDFIRGIETKLSLEVIVMTVGVTRMRGRDQVLGPKLSIYLTPNNMANEWDLDVNSEKQTDVGFNIDMSFPIFQKMRKENFELTFRLKAQTVDGTDSFNVYDIQIKYNQIHSEGFENWIGFGSGVQLFVKIQFNVSTEPNVSSEEVSKFHFQTILLMVEKRLQNYRAQGSGRPTTSSGHQSVGPKTKLTYIRPLVDLNSEDMFWSAPTDVTDIMQRIRNISLDPKPTQESQTNRLRNQLRKEFVKYNDLQIGYGFNDEFEDSVCLCSEWCNWSAFFHYNPIYRFLTVQHNQLYLQNRANIPDMYLFGSVYSATKTSILQANNPNQPMPKTPVIQLMSCANEYRKRYYEKYLLQRRSHYARAYRDSYPKWDLMNGLVYNSLRYHINITELCLQSDANPFSNICMENMRIYYSVSADLHNLMAPYERFVPKASKKVWYKEMEYISRQKYSQYIKKGYDKRIKSKDFSIDHLFTEDYEYLNILPKSDSERHVKTIRDQVIKVGINENPLNIQVLGNEFLVSFISVYKFLRYFEPLLPSIRSSRALNDMVECLKTFDRDFNAYANTAAPDDKNLIFHINDEILSQRKLLQYRKHFFLFYTLKLYSIGFGVQNYCIQTVMKFNAISPQNTVQVCTQFVLIWRNELIEYQFREKFRNKRNQKEKLFFVKTTFITRIDGFYGSFWGRAQHEIQGNQTIDTCIESAYDQYERLYFWCNNNGDDTRIFNGIVDAFIHNFNHIHNRSEELFNEYISHSALIYSLPQSNANYLEILDVLVLYLVKANCYLISRSVTLLVQRMHTIQKQALCTQNTSYSMSKPGWVKLFRTRRTIGRIINRLKATYIAFDDEINRIFNTLSQLNDSIKDIYKYFYRKLIREWFAETQSLYGLVNPIQKAIYILPIHLAVGLSFMAAFTDDFRKESQRVKKLFETLFSNAPNSPQQNRFKSCETVYRNYLSDKSAVQMANIFLWNDWKTHLSTQFTIFSHKTGSQLHIDMDAANA